MTNDPWKPPIDTGALPDADRPMHPYRTLALFGFCLASMLSGMIEAQRGDGWRPLVAALAMSTAATMWCIVDASSRGSYYRHSYRWLTMMTWPIAVPVYLMHSRGARGALLALFGLVGLLLSQAVGYLAGEALFGGR